MNRKMLKGRAKNSLKNGSIWTGYGINIVDNFISTIVRRLISTIFLALIFGQGYSLLLEIGKNPAAFDYMSDTQAFELARYLISQFSSVFIINMLSYGLIFIISLLFFNLIKVGKNFWFSRNREEAASPPFSAMFNFFKKGKYSKTVKGMAWRDFWLLIWKAPSLILSMLLALFTFTVLDQTLVIVQDNLGAYGLENIISDKLGMTLIVFLIFFLFTILVNTIFSIIAFIKSYSYRATEWILADNPDLDHKVALNLSKTLTRGYKWKWFVLDLSFIAWYALLVLTLPLILFTAPLLETYRKACHAEFYAELRGNAVNKGLITMEALGFVKIDSSQDQYYPSAGAFYQDQPENKNLFNDNIENK